MQDKTIPKEDNHVRLSKDLKNKCGVSQLITSIDCDKNDEKKTEIFSRTGYRNTRKS
jgi:hypothetical protein